MKHNMRWIGLGLAVASSLVGCGEDEKPRNTHYVAAEKALQQGCFASNVACHGKGGGTAMLDLGAAIASGDFRSALVGVPACEYDVMDRVVPGDTANSWLMVKLTAPFVSVADAQPPASLHGDLIFTPDASWDESRKCNPGIRGFGQRMPQVAPFEVDDEVLDALQTWIEVGAPGPNDPEFDAGAP